MKVAKLIWDHGRRFRELLGLDVEATPVLTSWERIAAAKAETATAKAAKVKAEAAEVAMKAERDRVQNAHRMQQQRQTNAKEAAKAKIKKEVAKLKAAQKDRQKMWRKETRAKLEKAATTKAEVKAAADKALRAQQVSKARERARAVEADAKAAKKAKADKKAAEAKVKDLKIRLDEVMEEVEAPESPETDDEPAAKQGRRDERGRFEAGPWQDRVLEWGQLGRAVPPSTINRNITEMMMVYAKEKVVPHSCERQMRKLRTEVTIAGEMIAALRVALCIRIISFGRRASTRSAAPQRPMHGGVKK